MSRQYIYSLALPPRPVPLLVRFQVLFGGFLNQFGWFFFGFGLIFFWVFALNADITSFYYFRGELETAKGVVVDSRNTGFSVGGSKTRRGTPIYANYYSFTAANGAKYQGVSYEEGFQPSGYEVTIEYPKGDPSVSRIQGMRRAVFPIWAGFAAIFALVGLCFVIVGLKNGIKANRLLTNGKPGLGKLKSKEPTNTRINNQTVYKFTFEFLADNGRTYEVVTKTHITRVLEDEEEERLLYDPFDPSYAVMLDSLPGSPRIDETGNIQVGNFLGGLLVMIAPGLSIIGHGTYAYLRFFK